jgi:pyruvate, orthophosphate dikinase
MSFIAESLDKIAHWAMPGGRRKCIYSLSEGSLQDEHFLSRKGANLCEVHRQGYSVPPAFILSSDLAVDFHESDTHQLDKETLRDIEHGVEALGKNLKQVFGSVSGPFPLLLSVRGGSHVNPHADVALEDANLDSVNTDIVDILGAPESWCIPGVKESCLGIGMNDDVAAHLANLTSPIMAYNTYAHFLVRFGTIVLGAQRRHYRRILTDHVQETGRSGANLTESDLRHIVTKFKLVAAVPMDPFTQLQLAIVEMYRCWFAPAAMKFRSDALGSSREAGTAVIVQSIVFGGTGVCFSRNPITGERGDSVFGTYWSKNGEKFLLNDTFHHQEPKAFEKLKITSQHLEQHFKDMQQFEFVYSTEQDKVFILDVHTGRRTPKAAMKIAVEMVAQRILTEREAVLRIDANKANFFLQRHMNIEHSKVFGKRPLVLHAIHENNQ